MTTLTGASGLGKIGLLKSYAGIVVALTGAKGTGHIGILTLPEFDIPNVVGVDVTTAQAILATNSFQIGPQTYEQNTTYPVGIVIRQSPIAGTSAVENSQVSLVISSGPPAPTNTPVTELRLPNLPNKILPPDSQLVDNRGVMNTAWWRFILNVANQAMGTNETEPATVTVTASPFIFTTPVQGTLLVSGGPVTLIEFSKDGITWFPMGLTQGQIQMVPNDLVRITYMNAPTLTFFSR